MVTQDEQEPGAARVAPTGLGTARRREPPKALFKLINPLLKAVLRSPLHGQVSNNLLILTFRGRKSGQVYSTPVGYHPQGDVLQVFTHSPWYHNFAGGANVLLWWRGQRVPARADLVTDQEEVFRNVLTILDKIGRQNAQRLGIMLPRGQAPSTAALREAAQGTVMVRLTPQGDKEQQR